ncbi:MAG: thioredoxin family protein [Clostridium sp.]|uniref:thioredoxin family protein n=1 Tax=Clostridium sp. TaxID=1506 RepID=UPI003057DC8D
MRIIVLGACCKKSAQMFENAKIAVEQMNLGVQVENTGDVMEIARYGVMQTPALVVNDKVLCYGKLLSPDKIIELIKKAIS